MAMVGLSSHERESLNQFEGYQLVGPLEFKHDDLRKRVQKQASRWQEYIVRKMAGKVKMQITDLQRNILDQNTTLNQLSMERSTQEAVKLLHELRVARSKHTDWRDTLRRI